MLFCFLPGRHYSFQYSTDSKINLIWNLIQMLGASWDNQDLRVACQTASAWKTNPMRQTISLDVVKMTLWIWYLQLLGSPTLQIMGENAIILSPILLIYILHKRNPCKGGLLVITELRSWRGPLLNEPQGKTFSVVLNTFFHDSTHTVCVSTESMGVFHFVGQPMGVAFYQVLFFSVLQLPLFTVWLKVTAALNRWMIQNLTFPHFVQISTLELMWVCVWTSTLWLCLHRYPDGCL